VGPAGLGDGVPIIAFVALFIVGWVITTWIRARHGYPLDDGTGRLAHRSGPSSDDIAKQVAKALADRDATIAKLEERVRVLERVVTDEGARVSREIEQLRST
jgi:hypothetical protein